MRRGRGPVGDVARTVAMSLLRVGDVADGWHGIPGYAQAAANVVSCVWFVTSQKNGVSALGLQRALGLGSYETAWTWLHKLRRAMVRPGRDCLTGTVEVDETYVGGPEEGKRGRGAEAKTIVAVAKERSGHRPDPPSAYQGCVGG